VTVIYITTALWNCSVLSNKYTVSSQQHISIGTVNTKWKDYGIGTAQEMSVDIDATPDLLLLIQQKLCIMHYRYCGLVNKANYNITQTITLCILNVWKSFHMEKKWKCDLTESLLLAPTFNSYITKKDLAYQACTFWLSCKSISKFVDTAATTSPQRLYYSAYTHKKSILLWHFIVVQSINQWGT